MTDIEASVINTLCRCKQGSDTVNHLRLDLSESKPPGCRRKQEGQRPWHGLFALVLVCTRCAIDTLSDAMVLLLFEVSLLCNEAEAKMGRHSRTCPARRTWSTFFAGSRRRRSYLTDTKPHPHPLPPPPPHTPPHTHTHTDALMSACLSVCPSVCPSVCQFVCPSVRRSVCLSVCLSVS